MGKVIWLDLLAWSQLNIIYWALNRLWGKELPQAGDLTLSTLTAILGGGHYYPYFPAEKTEAPKG